MTSLRLFPDWRPALLSSILMALAAPAAAADLSWSAFGSVGYAVSDSDFRWQRYISDSGTWQRDSLLAAQVDAQLAPGWSATAQAKIAPSLRKDSAWDPTLTWAFLAWRPDNDWLLRAGRLRIPLFLFSETQDVGTATPLVRLPNDLYSLAPTTDFNGLYATRSWALGERDLSVDVYSGYANTSFRQWLRDGAPPQLSPGPQFHDMRVRSTGMVWTLRDADSIWRAGLHRTQTSFRNGRGFTVRYPRVDLAPGVGYWQVDDALPGPGVPKVDSIANVFATAGFDWHVSGGWRLTAEVARARQHDTEFGVDAISSYVSVARGFGRFTPYVSASRLLSHRRHREWYERLSSSPLPPFVPGAAQVNASQQAAAESVTTFDQRSLAIGLSVQMSPGSRLKAEWMRSHIGGKSSMADAPPGVPIPRDANVDVLSLVYSFSF